ncbi:MAG: hypothetical protein KC442_20845 [Thermomicrobiales bacterium]|nr:hypothetical protein [Thermomicrobiales bacterium]
MRISTDGLCSPALQNASQGTSHLFNWRPLWKLLASLLSPGAWGAVAPPWPALHSSSPRTCPQAPEEAQGRKKRRRKICKLEATRCGRTCVNTRTDPRHCGGCDKRCDAGVECVNKTCGGPQPV